MNALWITRMSAYKNSSLCLETAKKIIGLKTKRQQAILKKYHLSLSNADFISSDSLQNILLEEARIAKEFWRQFKTLIPPSYTFPGRKPHSPDMTNRLLDIGYHHLAEKVKRLLEAHEISTSLGILHVARTSRSAPLAYDLMELFRSDVVDAEVLRCLRQKKKELKILNEKTIGRFLAAVNRRCERKYYMKDFGICQTYHYYMELQILKFMKAVNHREVFQPVILPNRHDTRCRLTSKKPHAILESGISTST